jgi:hypothetical protein
LDALSAVNKTDVKWFYSIDLGNGLLIEGIKSAKFLEQEFRRLDLSASTLAGARLLDIAEMTAFLPQVPGFGGQGYQPRRYCYRWHEVCPTTGKSSVPILLHGRDEPVIPSFHEFGGYVSVWAIRSHSECVC